MVPTNKPGKLGLTRWEGKENIEKVIPLFHEELRVFLST